VAIPRSDLVLPSADFAVALLTRPGVRARAQLAARRVTDLLPGTAAVVYVKAGAVFTAVAISGEVKVAAQLRFSPTGPIAILEGQAHTALFHNIQNGYGPLFFCRPNVALPVDVTSVFTKHSKSFLARRPRRQAGKRANSRCRRGGGHLRSVRRVRTKVPKQHSDACIG
jgi:hypothetical protein